MAQFYSWLEELRGLGGHQGLSGQSPASSPSSESFEREAWANGAHALATVAGYLLDRQIRVLALDFERKGGFTERLFKVRREARGY
jgi:four helix bundle suffix protein